MEGKLIYKEFEALMRRYERRKNSRIHKKRENPFKYKRSVFRNKGK